MSEKEINFLINANATFTFEEIYQMSKNDCIEKNVIAYLLEKRQYVFGNEYAKKLLSSCFTAIETDSRALLQVDWRRNNQQAVFRIISFLLNEGLSLDKTQFIEHEKLTQLLKHYTDNGLKAEVDKILKSILENTKFLNSAHNNDNVSGYYSHTHAKFDFDYAQTLIEIALKNKLEAPAIKLWETIMAQEELKIDSKKFQSILKTATDNNCKQFAEKLLDLETEGQGVYFGDNYIKSPLNLGKGDVFKLACKKGLNNIALKLVKSAYRINDKEFNEGLQHAMENKDNTLVADLVQSSKYKYKRTSIDLKTVSIAFKNDYGDLSMQMLDRIEISPEEFNKTLQGAMENENYALAKALMTSDKYNKLTVDTYTFFVACKKGYADLALSMLNKIDDSNYLIDDEFLKVSDDYEEDYFNFYYSSAGDFDNDINESDQSNSRENLLLIAYNTRCKKVVKVLLNEELSLNEKALEKYVDSDFSNEVAYEVEKENRRPISIQWTYNNQTYTTQFAAADGLKGLKEKIAEELDLETSSLFNVEIDWYSIQNDDALDSTLMRMDRTGVINLNLKVQFDIHYQNESGDNNDNAPNVHDHSVFVNMRDKNIEHLLPTLKEVGIFSQSAGGDGLRNRNIQIEDIDDREIERDDDLQAFLESADERGLTINVKY